jgi:hypothetical protein
VIACDDGARVDPGRDERRHAARHAEKPTGRFGPKAECHPAGHEQRPQEIRVALHVLAAIEDQAVSLDEVPSVLIRDVRVVDLRSRMTRLEHE